MLSELGVKSIEKKFSDDNKFRVELSYGLKINSEYTVMVVSLQNSNYEEMIFEDWIYNFTTWDSIIISEEDIEVKIDDDLNTWDDEDVDLNAWDIEDEGEKNPDVSGDIKGEEEIDLNSWVNEVKFVAKEVKETPDTWAETNILLILTFIMSSIVFIRKKILKA